MSVRNLPPLVAQSKNYMPPLPALRDFINMYRLNAKRILSQNYLMDMNVIRKIVSKTGDLFDNYIVEIGPGPGGITRGILETNCKRLDVIEIDKRFIPPLELVQIASNNRLHIHHGNILKTDIEKIWRDAIAPTTSWYDDAPLMHIIGNLPFNIASPLIIKFLEQISYRIGPWEFGRVPLTLTFQLEVANRLVGNIDSIARSRISLMAQYLTEPRLILKIPGDCFVPKPEVDVGVVQFIPRSKPLILAPFKLIEKVARHLFIHRRKFILKNIRTLYPDDLKLDMTHDLLHNCHVSPHANCYQIGMEEFADMCLYYQKQCHELPGLYLYDHTRKKITIDMLKDDPNAVPPNYKFEKLDKIENEGLSFTEFGKEFCIK